MITKGRLLLINLVVGLLLALFGSSQSQAQSQVSTQWSEPVNLSSKMAQAWFPDIGVDGQGGVHIIYSGNDLYSEKGGPLWEKYDRIYYQPVSNSGVVGESGPFNVAVSPFGVVTRNSLAVDNKRGLLHIIFRAKGSLFYQYAPVNKASLALAWSEPRNFDDFGSSYYSDIVVDPQGVIHVIWTQVKPDGASKLRQVVMYRQSRDLGVTWSFPKMVGAPRLAATRPVLKLDSQNGLHVSWDDGYDNYVASELVATYGAYTHSFDDGKTWVEPTWFGDPKEPIAQMVVTPFGSSGVMVAWRVLDKQTVGYAVSNDRGMTWTSPSPVPGLTARVFLAQHFFDRYYLGVDGKGRVHLATVAQLEEVKKGIRERPNDLAVFHSVWDKGEWSNPELVAQLTGYPEYPRLSIGPDRLHLVWFVRDKPIDDESKQLWYSSRPYDSGITAQPVGLYSPPKPTAVAVRNAATALPTSMVILPPVEGTPSRQWLEEGYSAVIFALLPIVGVGVLLATFVVWRMRHTTRK